MYKFALIRRTKLIVSGGRKGLRKFRILRYGIVVGTLSRERCDSDALPKALRRSRQQYSVSPAERARVLRDCELARHYYRERSTRWVVILSDPGSVSTPFNNKTLS